MANYKVAIQLDAEGNAVAKFQELNTELKQTKESAGDGPGGLLGQLGPLGAGIAAVGGAFAAWGVAQKALEMRDLGQTVTQTANTFTALQGGAQAAEITMNSLRTATRGLIDDTTLMGGASSMLRTGVAANNDELVRFMEMATALKKPTDSAAEAIDNFTAMMANQSVLRLDSFGISSARVTARIEELIAAGQAAGREDAFRMAVLEEGAAAMDRLGDSIEQNASQWDRLMVRGQNAIQSIGEAAFSVGEAVAGGINTALTAVDNLITRLSEVEQDRQVNIQIATEASQETTQDAVDAILNGVDEGVRDAYAEATGLTPGQLSPIMETIRAMIQGGAIEADQTAEQQIRQYEALTGQVVTGPQRQVIADKLQDYIESVAIQAAQQAFEENNWGPVVGRVTPEGAWTGGPGTDESLLRGAQQYQTAMAERQAEAVRRQRQQELSSLLALRSMQQTYGSMDQMGLAAGFDSTPWQERQMQQAQIEQRNVRQYSENMWESWATVRANQQREEQQQQFREWLPGAMTDVWGGITDAAARVSGFFENAAESARVIQSKMGEAGDKLATSLSGVLNLGVTGGFQGDVYSQIAQLITDESARQQFELGTGLSTTGQGAFQEVAGLIAGMTGDQQVMTAQGLAAFMQSGAFRPDMTTQDIMGQLGYMSKTGGQQFTVNAGDTYADLQARYGLNAQQVMNAAGITNSRLLQVGTYGMGDEYTTMSMGKGARDDQDPMRILAENAGKANDEIQRVRDSLDEINGYTADIKLKLTADASGLPNVIRELMSYNSLSGAFEGVVSKNGGTVPGGNARSQAGQMGAKR